MHTKVPVQSSKNICICAGLEKFLCTTSCYKVYKINAKQKFKTCIYYIFMCHDHVKKVYGGEQVQNCEMTAAIVPTTRAI